MVYAFHGSMFLHISQVNTQIPLPKYESRGAFACPTWSILAWCEKQLSTERHRVNCTTWCTFKPYSQDLKQPSGLTRKIAWVSWSLRKNIYKTARFPLHTQSDCAPDAGSCAFSRHFSCYLLPPAKSSVSGWSFPKACAHCLLYRIWAFQFCVSWHSTSSEFYNPKTGGGTFFFS